MAVYEIHALLRLTDCLPTSVLGHWPLLYSNGRSLMVREALGVLGGNQALSGVLVLTRANQEP